ncbi:MAG: FAD-dependent monooxygenase [Planctomycetes bacterium]|nr:FAD-dependent monooxygenase [Planctomycetota bacterium]
MTPPAASLERPPVRARVEVRHVVIAGGGLVGCTLAVALGRLGVPVTVLERHASTPELLRGESILPAGVEVWRQLGLLDALEPHLVATEGVELRHPAFPAPLALLHERVPGGEALRGRCGWRRPLYEALRAACRATPGVDLREGAEVVAAARGDDRRVVVRTKDGEALRAGVLVVADGQGSRVRGLLGLVPLDDRVTSYVQGLVVRAPSYARRRVVVGAHPLGAAFVFPFPGGQARVTFEHHPERRAEVAERRPLDLLREALPDVWLELGGEAIEPVTPLQVQPGRSVSVSTLVEDGVVLAGDAAGCLDPFTGHGMALGLLDVATLVPLLAAGDPSSVTLRAHERARLARLAARREGTEALCAAFLDGGPLATALAARLGARWADPRVLPAVCAQAAGLDLPGTSTLAERLFALGVL